MITSKLRQQLQAQSSDLYARLQVLDSRARQLLEYAQGGGHLSFTTHGLSHISAVEKNYDWLLSDSDTSAFTAAETFCLLAASLFHDALMVPRKLGDEATARTEHVSRARDFLIKNRDSLALSLHEADAIAEVIKGHAVNKIGDIKEKIVLGSELVDLRKLGACLSVSDISHADSSRAPEIVFKHLELNEESRFHWRRHLQISGITRKDDSLIMSAVIFSDDGQVAVTDYKNAIQGQLTSVSPYFNTVLSPIRRVELIISRLESPLQQKLRFQTNTPAILKLLIEGVYDRDDVFVRELVQNSLDACLVRRARQGRRNLTYQPQILLTFFTDRGSLRAFRVDDNGVGMDINDVQDTVMWIGSTISNRSDVVELLQQTLGKNLIATFGIGLLSCFKVSSSVKVRTAKESGTPVEVHLTSISDDVTPEKASDTSIGTTIIVTLDDAMQSIDGDAAVEHHFRMITQAEVKILKLPWSAELAAAARDRMFKVAIAEAETLSRFSYLGPGERNWGVEIHGDDFSGAIWLPSDNYKGVVNSEGTLDILSEGVFVANEPTDSWLPLHFAFCNGFLNFSSKSINLPAGRDRVIKNDRTKLKMQDVAEKTIQLVDFLVGKTQQSSATNRDFAAAVLSRVFELADESWKNRILRRLDRYQVRKFKSEATMSLSDLRQAMKTVYLEYNAGRWVSDLGAFGGKTLYHKEDDLVELQAALKAQDGETVLTLTRADADPRSKEALESTMVNAYLRMFSIKTVDLAKTNVIVGTQRSKPVPSIVRQEVGNFVKFVDVLGLPSGKSWKVGNEVWINTANPLVEQIYSQLQNETLSGAQLKAAVAIVHLLAFDFEEALSDLVSSFVSKSRTGIL